MIAPPSPRRLMASAQRAKSVYIYISEHPFMAVHAVPRMEGSPDRLGLAALGLPRRRGGGLLSFAVLCHSLQIDAISVVSGVSRLLRQHDFDR
mmetsp:Transcript_11857/g.36561  ORF Transcript_11857/g.36561 Transcript_11857/m.36561 type:complete len:93 (+) Transcript_11857:685-963(+)